MNKVGIDAIARSALRVPSRKSPKKLQNARGAKTLRSCASTAAIAARGEARAGLATPRNMIPNRLGTSPGHVPPKNALLKRAVPSVARELPKSGVPEQGVPSVARWTRMSALPNRSVRRRKSDW